jgi:DNA-binding IclR family transcriptional regulator
MAMSEKITAQDEQKVLKILDLVSSGLTFNEVEENTELDHAKLTAVLEALSNKGYISRVDAKYILQMPLEGIKEPNEQ